MTNFPSPNFPRLCGLIIQEFTNPSNRCDSYNQGVNEGPLIEYLRGFLSAMRPESSKIDLISRVNFISRDTSVRAYTKDEIDTFNFLLITAIKVRECVKTISNIQHCMGAEPVLRQVVKEAIIKIKQDIRYFAINHRSSPIDLNQLEKMITSNANKALQVSAEEFGSGEGFGLWEQFGERLCRESLRKSD